MVKHSTRLLPSGVPLAGRTSCWIKPFVGDSNPITFFHFLCAQGAHIGTQQTVKLQLVSPPALLPYLIFRGNLYKFFYNHQTSWKQHSERSFYALQSRELGSSSSKPSLVLQAASNLQVSRAEQHRTREFDSVSTSRKKPRSVPAAL